MLKIDMDRLRRVTQERPTGVRGAGRTFAACFKLAVLIGGILQSDVPFYSFLYPVANAPLREYTIRMLCEHLSEEGMTNWRIEGSTVKVNGRVVVYFITPNRYNLREHQFNAIADDFGEFMECADETSRKHYLSYVEYIRHNETMRYLERWTEKDA